MGSLLKSFLLDSLIVVLITVVVGALKKISADDSQLLFTISVSGKDDLCDTVMATDNGKNVISRQNSRQFGSASYFCSAQ